MLRFRLEPIALLVSFAMTDASAGVLVVEAGGPTGTFREIQSAVTAAAPGDVVLVRPGTYAAFVVDAKPISIVAETGAVVNVVGDCSIHDLPAGSDAFCRGIDFVKPTSSPGTRLSLLANLGRVRIEDCSFAPNDAISILTQPRSTVIVESCTSATFARCLIVGRDSDGPLDAACHALDVASSTVRVEASTLHGGNGADSHLHSTSVLPVATPGAAALRVAGAEVFVGGSTIRGGKGGDGSGDMLLEPCDPPGPSGPGILLTAPGGIVRALASSVECGAPGLVFGFCEPSDDPKPVVVTAASGTALYEVLSGAANVAIGDATVPEHGIATIEIIGTAGQSAFALIGIGADATFIPSVSSVLYEATSPLFVVALGAIPANGSLTVTIPLQLALPALSALTSHVQAATCAGAECRLGSPTVVTILDSGI